MTVDGFLDSWYTGNTIRRNDMNADDAYILELETELSEAYILGDRNRAAHIEEMLKEFYDNLED